MDIFFILFIFAFYLYIATKYRQLMQHINYIATKKKFIFNTDHCPLTTLGEKTFRFWKSESNQQYLRNLFYDRKSEGVQFFHVFKKNPRTKFKLKVPSADSFYNQISWNVQRVFFSPKETNLGTYSWEIRIFIVLDLSNFRASFNDYAGIFSQPQWANWPAIITLCEDDDFMTANRTFRPVVGFVVCNSIAVFQSNTPPSIIPENPRSARLGCMINRGDRMVARFIDQADSVDVCLFTTIITDGHSL